MNPIRHSLCSLNVIKILRRYNHYVLDIIIDRCEKLHTIKYTQHPV